MSASRIAVKLDRDAYNAVLVIRDIKPADRRMEMIRKPLLLAEDKILLGLFFYFLLKSRACFCNRRLAFC